jgi:hypothetical protein
VIGASVGLIAWFAPGLVGGGDPLMQQTLVGNDTVSWLALLFLLRFASRPFMTPCERIPCEFKTTLLRDR